MKVQDDDEVFCTKLKSCTIVCLRIFGKAHWSLSSEQNMCAGKDIGVILNKDFKCSNESIVCLFFYFRAIFHLRQCYIFGE